MKTRDLVIDVSKTLCPKTWKQKVTWPQQDTQNNIIYVVFFL